VLLERLGAGGMGEVYLARDEELGREVALKVLPDEVSRDPESVARFRREARLASQLSHAAIATIYEAGEDSGRHFIAMELVRGETLAARVRPGGLALERVLEIAIPLAEGLAEAHAAGIVHRDLKPGNVMVDARGRVKILDFGLSRSLVEALREMSDLTSSGVVMGTPHYMSPEQARGEKVDERSDLFSLGTLLYELATGARPFPGDHLAQVMQGVLQETPPSILSVNPHAGELFAHTVERLLAKDPAARFQSAAGVVAALKSLKEPSTTIAAAGASPRRRVLLAVLSTAVVVAIGLVVVTWRTRGAGAGADGRRSIAVLPFQSERADPELDYLREGLTESLIGHLSPLPALRVMARSTVYRYSDPEIEPRDAGRELDVQAVLVGRVDRRDEILVIRAELMDVASGVQLWGQRFNCEMDDLFAIEEEISRAIAGQLEIRLRAEDDERLAARGTDDPEAYRLYLEGRYHWNRRSPESVRKGLEFFERALERDPDFAAAHVGVADSYVVMGGTFLDLPAREALKRAHAAAERALALDERRADAHASLGSARFHDWDWSGSEEAFLRAIELDPDYPSAHQWYGELLSTLGRHAEAEEQVARALEVDPLSLIANSVMGWTHLFAGDYDEARTWLDRALELEPDFVDALAGIAVLARVQGRSPDERFDAESRFAHVIGLLDEEQLATLRGVFDAKGLSGFWSAYLTVLERAAEQRFVPRFHRLNALVNLGETDRALDVLEDMVEAKDGHVPYLLVWPLGDLRSEPRFEEIMSRVL